MRKLLLFIIPLFFVFLVKAQTKDSTYKTTHDSTFKKTITSYVQVPYDSFYYKSVFIDTTVSHDSSFLTYNRLITDRYVPVIFLTTHDSSTFKLRTKVTSHDSTFLRCNRFGGRCRVRHTTATHDTAFFVGTISPVSHDTTFLQKISDTTYPAKDTLAIITHDSSFYRVIFTSEVKYKTVEIKWDSLYIQSVTHDTTSKFDIIVTSWGIKIQRDKFENQLNVARQLKVTSIRPNAIGVKNYNGQLNNVVDWKQAGLKTVININWIEDNTQKPFDFVHGSDTTLYKINFERICQDIIPYADVLVIENEPTNGGYYNWNFAWYEWELRTAITIAHKYGLKVADGCTHIELIELVRIGEEYRNENAPEVHQLLDLYKTLNLDYINLHTSYNKDSKFNNGYPVPDMKLTVDWARNYTGHQSIVNEWVVIGATDEVERKMVNDFRSCNMPYVVGWSGSGEANSGDRYNIGVVLTNIGTTFMDEIK